jgi:phosphate-selective porin OprO/OprP
MVRGASASVLVLMSVLAQPLNGQTTSETQRLEKLERAVELLEKQNAELKTEINSLKATQAMRSSADGVNSKAADNEKQQAEKAIVEEKKPAVYVQQRGSELKLVLGGYIQMNFEDGDVSAFEGSFGQRALKDRFRLRRARVNLTGDFAEQFDFKVEGDFGQGDGLNSNRTAFSATDIFINWHQFPEAQFKVGQWKAPFGLEQLTPDPTLIIIERSLPTGAITPDRQIGAQLGASHLPVSGPIRKIC